MTNFKKVKQRHCCNKVLSMMLNLTAYMLHVTALRNIEDNDSDVIFIVSFSN